NEKAGTTKYEGVEYDNGSDVTKAVTVASQLVTDGVTAVIGPATSGGSAASYQVLNDAGIFVVSPSATQNNITLDPNGKVYDNVFRVCFEDSYQGAGMAQYAKDTLGKTKAVIFGDSDSDYSKGLVEAFTNQFAKVGGTVVTTEYYTAGDTDFSATLTKVKGMDFDCIYVAGYYSEAGLIIKQAKDMGINCTFIGPDGFDSEVLVELAGAENLNDVFYTTGYTTINASEELTAFIEAYKAEYGQEPSMFAALAYDATNCMIQAIEAAGSTDAAAINAAMTGINFSGVTGSFTFDDVHTPIKTVLVVELENGVQGNAESVSPK
ncbi:MAG: ABC transporter substrate-binding protein, partial [Erysipelotrichaceae bacterium]|nr:ABC transporter substrate-binding protein [Erysipelotrichaceae bacterium]